MYKKLFVLFVVLVLAVSLGFLFKYDKKILENEEEINNILENQENNLETEHIESEEEFLADESPQEEHKYYETQEILGTLIIEKIGVHAEVKEGSTEEVLERYVGHIEETPKYDGNVGLAAHNRGNEVSYFERLNEIQTGDKIIYKSEEHTRTYIVCLKKEIIDTDWSLLQETQDNRLTLITCINNKPNLRLCVQAVEEARR